LAALQIMMTQKGDNVTEEDLKELQLNACSIKDFGEYDNENKNKNIRKRKYIGNIVAVKKLDNPDLQLKKVAKQAKIVKLLSACDHIEKFYGIYEEQMEGKNYLFVVTKWMENGNLKGYLANKKQIPWSTKLNIAYQIALALEFCNDASVYHRDVRSFAVLLWEISSHKIPFDEIDNPIKASEKAKAGGRPGPFSNGTPQQYKELIEKAWHENHMKRPAISEVGEQLENMLKIVRKGRNKLLTRSDTSASLIDESEDMTSNNSLGIKEAISLYENDECKKAFPHFLKLARDGDPEASYYAGLCLFYEKGGIKKDEIQALQLFQKSAENNHVGGQYMYAYACLRGTYFSKEEGLKYLKKSALIHKHPDALYMVSQLFLNGDLGYPVDDKKYKEYLEKAAQAGSTKAIEELMKELITIIRKYKDNLYYCACRHSRIKGPLHLHPESSPTAKLNLRTSMAETNSVTSGTTDIASVEINKEDLIIKSIYKLSEDLIGFLNKPEGYDVKLEIGKEPDVEEFYAHSAILRARSSYFYKALSKNLDKENTTTDNDGGSTVAYIYTAISKTFFMTGTEEGNVVIFKKENIAPKAFRLLLNIIYGGSAKMSGLTPPEFLELLEAYDELGIQGFDDYLQQYFLENNREWIRDNLLTLEAFSSKHGSFRDIRGYCLDQLCQNSDLVFRPTDIKEINKGVIIELLKRDDLIAEEIDLWNFVIQWGVAQVPGVTKEDGTIDWTKEEEVGKLKEAVRDLVSLIRFKWIGHEDFYDKVRPCKLLFESEVYEKTMKHYFTVKNHASSPIQVQTGSLTLQEPSPVPPSPTVSESALSSGSKAESAKPRAKYTNFIIKENGDYESLISSWIDKKKYDQDYQPYKFKLLYKGSANKFSYVSFHEKCDTIPGTLVIARIKDTGELVGGYNPRRWNPKKVSGRVTTSTYPIYCAKSFIFKLDGENVERSIISRIKEPYNALCHKKDSGPNFYDLAIYNQTTPVTYEQKYYDTDLNLKAHLLEDYEVYRVLQN
ncbi:15543_t:CDS:2, partial [Acaulospora colombiana]